MNHHGERIDWQRVGILLTELKSARHHDTLVRRLRARYPEVSFVERREPGRREEPPFIADQNEELTKDELIRWLATAEFPQEAVRAGLVRFARAGALEDLESLLDAALGSGEEVIDQTGDLPSLIPFAPIAACLNETTGPRIWGRVLASAEKATDAFLTPRIT